MAFTEIIFSRTRILKLLSLGGLDKSEPELSTNRVVSPLIQDALRDAGCVEQGDSLRQSTDLIYSALHIFESLEKAKEELTALVEMLLKSAGHSNYISDVHDEYGGVVTARLKANYDRDLITIYSSDLGWLTGQMMDGVAFEDMCTCLTG